MGHLTEIKFALDFVTGHRSRNEADIPLDYPHSVELEDMDK
jgi:hypothetical protein